VSSVNATETRHVRIGERIRRIRSEQRKMRQVDLAEAAGMSWRHLIRMEQGRGGEPKLETLERIAAALDVDIDEITGGDAPFPAEAA
jgi:transcriptional regulator with XRE-family HTH domain